MVEFQGVQYSPWRDGAYRCNWKCHNPDFPAPKWKTEKGFLKHLEGCGFNPNGPQWVKPADTESRQFAECPDCGSPIMEFTSCWRMKGKTVCIDCHVPYLVMGMGFHDCAGFELPGVTLEG